MTNLRRVFAASAFLAASGFAAAHAQGASAGDYKLAVGSAAPCTVSLAADGSATIGAACAHVGDVSHWHRTPAGLQLEDNAGAVVAILKAKGDAYAGQTFADNHQLVLTPASEQATLAH